MNFKMQSDLLYDTSCIANNTAVRAACIILDVNTDTHESIAINSMGIGIQKLIIIEQIYCSNRIINDAFYCKRYENIDTY